MVQQYVRVSFEMTVLPPEISCLGFEKHSKFLEDEYWRLNPQYKINPSKIITLLLPYFQTEELHSGKQNVLVRIGFNQINIKWQICSESYLGNV